MFPRPWGEQIPQSLPQGRGKLGQQIAYELGLGVRGRVYALTYEKKTLVLQ